MARCLRPGCETPAAAGQLACRTDWFRLPRDIRNAVWAGYRVEPLGEQHMAAVNDALEWYARNPREVL